MFLYNCNDINFLRLIVYIKAGFSLILYLIPIILIITITLDFVKGVINVEEGFKNMWKVAGKRITAIIILFFIPTIVNAIFSTMDNVTENSLACYNEATNENIERITIEAVETYTKNLDESKLTLTEISKLEKLINKIPNKTIQEQYKVKLDNYKKVYNAKQKEIEEQEKEKRAEIRKKQEENKNSTKNKTIFIGDSEVVLMCEEYGLCSSDSYFAEGGVACDYMETVKSKVNNKIASDEYNIVIILGFNGAATTKSSGADEAERCFRKASNLAKNDWKKQNVVYVSVNPCDDAHAAANGMIITNTAINEFNRIMKSRITSSNISNLSYCDTNSSLNIKEIDLGDGAHYNKKGEQQVYDIIKNKCLK